MLREIAYGLFGIAVLAYTLEWSLGLFHDPREPPRLRPKVPLIGHLLGLIKYGGSYYKTTSQQTDAEIYTLDFFWVKMYITNTQRLTPLIQKSSKTLSFRPFMQTAAKVMGGASDETFDLFGTELIDRFEHCMKNGLAPGPHLDAQNLRMGNRALVDVDLLIKSIGGAASKQMSLVDWTRFAVVQASSCGVFGADHPFLDPKVEEAFWVWQSYLTSHLIGLDVTRKGYAARDIVFDAFVKYCKSMPEDASFVIRERERVLLEGGVSEEDVSRQQASFCIGVFANTVPTMYWALYELFSRPDLLEAVREEVAQHAVSGSKTDGFVLDVAAVKVKCPLLLATLQETQRVRHNHANIRKVLSDTHLDGKYLLKNGHYVQIPPYPPHNNPKSWGESVASFDPHRFLPKENGSQRAREPSSFVAWGAAPHLCPARQFATTEVLILAALLALRVDMAPAGGKPWERDPAVNTAELVTLFGPLKNLQVDVVAREEWLGNWELKMGESSTRVSLASG